MVAVAVFGLAASGLNVSLAHAEAGRRICVYGEYFAATGSEVQWRGLAVIDYKIERRLPHRELSEVLLERGRPGPDLQPARSEDYL